jgi:hypothetical protein
MLCFQFTDNPGLAWVYWSTAHICLWPVETGKAKEAPVISEDVWEARVVTDEASVLELFYVPS